MLHIKRYSLALLLILSLSAVTHSLKIPEAPLGRVSDWAGILSGQAKSDIENTLQAFEDNTGIQIAVATFPSLEGGSLEDFSIHLAEKWKIGQKGKDNGVIMLVFPAERKIRIEVGYGLEGALPDAAASSIIRSVIAPRFKEGDYDGGIKEGVNTIIRVLSGEEALPQEQDRNNTFYGLNKQKIMNIIFIVLGILGFIFLIDIFRFGGYASNHKTYGQRYSFIEWLVLFSITLFILKLLFYMMLSGRSRGGFGGGSGGWGGGGGFSGGGGSFGGGGSSGSW